MTITRAFLDRSRILLDGDDIDTKAFEMVDVSSLHVEEMVIMNRSSRLTFEKIEKTGEVFGYCQA